MFSAIKRNNSISSSLNFNECEFKYNLPLISSVHYENCISITCIQKAGCQNHKSILCACQNEKSTTSVQVFEKFASL